jgi:hypothetical protein
MTSIRHPARKLTYEDYCRIPEDRCRHEILDGEHVVSPAPYVAHQLVLGRLHAELFAQLERRKLGRDLPGALLPILHAIQDSSAPQWRSARAAGRRSRDLADLPGALLPILRS